MAPIHSEYEMFVAFVTHNCGLLSSSSTPTITTSHMSIGNSSHHQWVVGVSIGDLQMGHTEESLLHCPNAPAAEAMLARKIHPAAWDIYHVFEAYDAVGLWHVTRA